MSMTITEALAEIKTIGKRLEKKKAAVMQYMARDSRLMDPLSSDGGSVEYIKSERQSIEDLEKRIVSIRTAIQKSNLATQATVGENAMSIAEWLTFRREVAAGRQQFLASMNNGIRNIRDKVQKEGGRVVAAVAAVADSGSRPVVEIIVHFDEKELLNEQEDLEKTLGDLDGKLSLLNATTVIEV